METKTKQKATLYLSSAIGTEIVRAEGYLIKTEFVDYAQYKNTPQIDFKFKGKRHTTRFVKGYNPFFLILEGWDTPKVDESLYFDISESDGVVTKSSIRLSHDIGNYTVFNDFIKPLLKDYKVLFDYRFMLIAEQKYKEMDKETSLLNAIENKDKTKIKEIEERANKGEVVRII